MDDTRAFYWIANQEKYIDEAIVSATSVKRNMPDVVTILGIPGGTKHLNIPTLDEIYPLDVSHHDKWFQNLCFYQTVMVREMRRRGIDYAVYMDTDTYMCAPAYDLFDIVMGGRYSIAGVHAPGRYTGKTFEYVPDAFPEINIGVSPMFTLTCQFLWQHVYEAYCAHSDVYNNNDQGVLRETLFYNSDRWPLYILPPEYNIRLFPSFINKEVKIIHGRSEEDYQSIANKLNQSKGIRLWYQGKVLE